MKKVGRVFGYIVLAIGAFLSLFPFYFMFVSGTNTNAQILSVPPKLTIGTELAKNFAILSGKIDLLQSTWNTLFISVVYTVLACSSSRQQVMHLQNLSLKEKRLFTDL